jgi:dipeptidyl aminopeptidase/acylaminoacyl peptidase
MLDQRLVRSFVPSFVAVAFAVALPAQAGGSGWLQPPEAIRQLVEAPPPPSASLSPQRTWLVLVQREAMPGLDVVARPHLKLAGLRVDPEIYGGQLGAQTVSIELRALDGGRTHRVDVPAGHWSGPIWTADDRAFALVRHAEGGGELWIADPATAPPRRVVDVRVNEVLRDSVSWLPDQRRLLVTAVVPGAPPARPRVPAGPQVQVSQRDEKAQVRTYQDLLQDAHDEALLEHYGTSRLTIVDAATGAAQAIGAPAMYASVDPSPDGTMLLVDRIQRPFSYLLPLSQFPRSTAVLGLDGRELAVVARQPMLDTVPIGGVPTGRRSVGWVACLEHTLIWVEAQDGGDPRREAAIRDHVMLATEPAAEPRRWFATEHRFGGIQCAEDGRLVLASEIDRKTRRMRLWRYDLGQPSSPGVLVHERSMQDAYGDPGRPLGLRTRDGRSLLRYRDGAMFLSGDGASKDGNRPFVDRWSVESGEKQRLFQAVAGRFETLVGLLDDEGNRAVVRSESATEPPSLVLVDLRSGERQELLRFPDPAAEFVQKVQKRLVRYEREDGVPLSGTLYLPPGAADGEKLPCLVWAYPLEYTQASDAGQVRAAPDRYLRLGGTSHLFLLLHGYAVFDDAAMPIVGPRRTANDTFVEQVQMNARAAVKALRDTGSIDEKRIAVAGHSYGAFMTANLLAHTDLFACGIARSGAYNRTLTPFGFQNEERTFWEAPQIYQAMSPFSHAEKINEPILLVHGDDDNNSGTFPIQSQRLFAAIKGHGGVARLCMLPHESHGYRARENVLHCLAEMCAWLDAHMQAK